MTGKCPGCGREAKCADCGYTEPFFIFMPSHHHIYVDGEEVALAENVEFYLPEIWGLLKAQAPSTPVFSGACVYKYTDRITPKALSGRVTRIPLATYRRYGNSFIEPKGYRERRDSDQKSTRAHLSSRRALNAIPTTSK